MAAGKCNIIFSDIDGTLIFSEKRRKVGDIVIEYKDGEPISCITARQAEIFPRLTNVIPVTTRSIEQYKRIEFAKFGFSPKYALCDNGGTLLVDGEVNAEWAKWSGDIYRECETEMSRFRELLERDSNRSFEVRLVDGLFLFTKSSRPSATLDFLGCGELCECFATGEKVYVVPRKLGKGAAVKRFARLYGIAEFAAAGDSLMDLSMLNSANTAVFADTIPENAVTASVKLSCSRGDFTDFVTEFADKLQKK
ncbi:MAG: hypothetical protein MR364_08180 [Oscillospiraceae bacterium]|nr:hypothetical protein [Oscillospiraceae bacterium]